MKIAHDFHIHTNLSICANETAQPGHYLKKAKELGLKKIGFSNHFWDDRIEVSVDAGCEWGGWFYRDQNYEHLQLLRPQLAELDFGGVEVYFGCEIEYDRKRRDISITEETAEKFDYILVPNSHTHITMPRDCYEPYQKHVDYMIQAYEDILNSKLSHVVTAIAHPFDAVACPYDNSILIDMISDDCFKRLFDKTAQKGIGVEINMSGIAKQTPEGIAARSDMRMFRLAKECGCKFIFGSDAHDDQMHEIYNRSDIVADIIGLKEEDILEIAR